MQKKHGILTRRDFIRGTAGTALGVSLMGPKWLHSNEKKTGSSLVIIVRDQNVMDVNRNIDTGILKKMLDQAVTTLTGKKNIQDAWLSLLSPKDTIGLVPTPHLNPTHTEVIENKGGSRWARQTKSMHCFNSAAGS